MDNFYQKLSYLANLCQVCSFYMNLKEASNDEIMKELQNQDIILDKQTNDYLEKIIEQNNEILRLLKGE